MRSTNIRATVSPESKYYISKERFLELKHFCLQYKEWVDDYEAIESFPSRNINLICDKFGYDVDSFVERQAIRSAELSNKINLVNKLINEADDQLAPWLFKGVTTGIGYASMYDAPCSKDMYYDRYRKFFFLLSKER